MNKDCQSERSVILRAEQQQHCIGGVNITKTFQEEEEEVEKGEEKENVESLEN